MSTLADLQAENQALRQQLEGLLREARSNEDKMRRFEQLEHRLIAAGSLAELARLLLREYQPAFGLDAVSLTLLDRELELGRVLGPALSDADAGLQGLSLQASPAALQALYGETQAPRLGPYRAELHASLFGAQAPGLASVALLPLSRRGQLIGSLHFGSRDPQRYEAQAGTKFLERLAAIAAVCLESVLAQERLKLAGLTDALTGVHNRRYFEHRCPIEIAQARRYRLPLACLFLDIDHFKQINDRHGHASGDGVLRMVGLMIQGQLRAGDTIARWGGEEFVLLLPRASAAAAHEIAERVRLRIAGQAFPATAGGELQATVSIGLAMLDEQDRQTEPRRAAEALVATADRALYQAKSGGRNRVSTIVALPA